MVLTPTHWRLDWGYPSAPRKKTRNIEGVLGVWTGRSTPHLPWSPLYAPTVLTASQRWSRSSKVLPKTTGCHWGRQAFQAACDQIFIRTGWMYRAVHGGTANISLLLCPEGRSRSQLSKPAFSGGNQAITSPFFGLGSMQRTYQAACTAKDYNGHRTRALCLSCLFTSLARLMNQNQDWSSKILKKNQLALFELHATFNLERKVSFWSLRIWDCGDDEIGETFKMKLIFRGKKSQIIESENMGMTFSSWEISPPLHCFPANAHLIQPEIISQNI